MKVLLFVITLIVTCTAEEVTISNQFAASVYKVLAKTKQENLLFSPLSANVIIALAQSGGEGSTAAELQQILGYPADSTLIEKLIGKILSRLEANDVYRLNLANKMYVEESFPIKKTFKNTALQSYMAEVQNINFYQKKAATDEINQWVEEKTQHKIQNLIGSDVLNNQTKLVLVNALYFRANWTASFEKSSKRLFYPRPGKAISVDTMFLSDESFKYCEDLQLNAKFLELPMTGNNISMTIILPKSHYGLKLLEKNFEKVLAPHPYTEEVVTLALPKFKIESKIDLKSTLKHLGVHTAFDECRADFRKIADNDRNLFISDMVQKAYVKCDENGIEGAAASYVVKFANRIGGFSKDFIVDRPFLFYIKVKQVIVFIGRVSSPSIE